MGERWAPVPNYEGLYEVSDAGRVRSLPRTVRTRGSGTRVMGGHILTARTSRNDGRRDVTLNAAGRARPALVAHLVLAAFVGPRPDGLVACHRDDVVTNDRLDNLRWDTQGSNLLDRSDNGNDPHRQRERCPRDHLLQEPNLVLARWRDLGHRVCRACAKAQSSRAVRERGTDLQAVSDAYYAEIIRSATPAP